MPRRDAPQDVRHDGLRLHNDERGTPYGKNATAQEFSSANGKADAARPTPRDRHGTAAEHGFRDGSRRRSPAGFRTACAAVRKHLHIWNHPNTHSPSYDRNRPLKRPTGGPHGRRTAVHPSSRTLLLQKGRIAPARSPSFAKGACVPLPAKKEMTFRILLRGDLRRLVREPVRTAAEHFYSKTSIRRRSAIKRRILRPVEGSPSQRKACEEKPIERFRDHRRPVSVPHRPRRCYEEQSEEYPGLTRGVPHPHILPRHFRSSHYPESETDAALVRTPAADGPIVRLFLTGIPIHHIRYRFFSPKRRNSHRTNKNE